MKKITIEIDSKTDLLPYTELCEFQGDLKTLTKENFEKLRKQILEQGFSYAIHVWFSAKDNKNYILDGHQRLRVIKYLVETEKYECPPLPVVFVRATNFKAARKKLLAGASQYGNVQKDALHEELEKSEIDFDEFNSNFNFPEVNADSFKMEFYDDNTIEAVEDAGAGEPPKIPKSKRGDIWTLGVHRLMCGDSTVLDDVEKLMDGAKADMVWTDPPYNVAYEGKTKDALKIENDSMGGEEFYAFLQQAFLNMFISSKPGSAIYIAHADSEGLNFRRAMIDAGWLLKQNLVWVKNSLVMGRQDYHWKHEPILYGWAPGASHNWFSDRKQTTVLNFDRPQKNTEHPTMKPLDLIAYCVNNSCPEAGLVLDLFSGSGSGSVIMVCQNTGRRGYGMELDPRYCDVILTRWSKSTGLEPIRDDGAKWSEISK